MSRGLSLHVGINSVDPSHYNGWDGSLRACELDARDMEAIAKQRGFEPTVLLTQEGTADAVKNAIRRAASELGSGDFFWLTYSGHGGQVTDTNSDDETDTKDETWVLYDRQLVDDELYALWSEFKEGVRIFVLSDSCHSGSVTREIFDAAVPSIVAKGMVDDDRPKTKELPKDVETATETANAQLYKDIQASHPSAEKVDVSGTVLLISGCQDNQLSLDGTRNGMFTQQLRAVWNDGRWQGSYPVFHKAIGARMPPTQTPNYYTVGAANGDYERQTPLTL